MREIKFRAWHNLAKEMFFLEGLIEFHNGILPQGNGVIQQFTGLTDCNGKEVYEGDIVKYDFEPCGEQTGVFQFLNGWFCLKGSNNWRPTKFEVIGNIFENPELLN